MKAGLTSPSDCARSDATKHSRARDLRDGNGAARAQRNLLRCFRPQIDNAKERILRSAILAAGLWLPAILSAQERITVLYPSPAGSWMIPVIAKEAKYFEREGLAMEYVRVGGSTRIVAALLGGSAEIIHAGEPAVVPAVQ